MQQDAIQELAEDPFLIAGRSFTSRLLVGTGKYKDMAETKAAIEATGAEIITVAVRRIPLDSRSGESLQAALPPGRYTYLPNTAGCYTAEEAVRTLMLARELGGGSLVKLEVMDAGEMLYPHLPETLKAAALLVQEKFDVMVYTTDDLGVAKELAALGVAAIMPLAAPIGSGLGIQNPSAITRIINAVNIPVLVDAGIGTPSDAAIAMELGCDAVLMNTAIAEAGNPVAMGCAMKLAVRAGRLAYRARPMPRRAEARPSSPVHGKI